MQEVNCVGKLDAVLVQKRNDVCVIVQVIIFRDEMACPSKQRHLDQIVVLRIAAYPQAADRLNKQAKRIKAHDNPVAGMRANAITKGEARSSEHAMDFIEIRT